MIRHDHLPKICYFPFRYVKLQRVVGNFVGLDYWKWSNNTLTHYVFWLVDLATF